MSLTRRAATATAEAILERGAAGTAAAATRVSKRGTAGTATEVLAEHSISMAATRRNRQKTGRLCPTDIGLRRHISNF